jgi:transcriptional regulator with XRE-family HTH domain
MNTKRKSAAVLLLEKLGGEYTFGAMLSSIREGEELSQAEMARRLGVSRSHLCDIEKGRKAVSPARAAEFALVLGMSEKQFVRVALQELVNETGLKVQVVFA